MNKRISFLLFTLLTSQIVACSSDGQANQSSKVSQQTLSENHANALQTGDARLDPTATHYLDAALIELNNIAKKQQGAAQIVDIKPAMNSSITALLISLRDNKYNFDLAKCSNPNKCDAPNFMQDFNKPAMFLKRTVDKLDEDKVDLFTITGNNWLKNIVLLADHYRQQATFPMGISTTTQAEFMHSYFADHIVYGARALNPAQRDMGNFSRSNFSHITPQTKGIELASRKKFRASGAYALPGQTFTITRTDTTEEETYFFINTLRPGATQAFSDSNKKGGKYNRPEFLRSVQYDIEPGESVSITSPYGGPIQIGFNSSAGNLTKFSFQQVGEHPYYDGDTSPQAIAQFNRQLKDNDYDWAEFSTRYFEVHSTIGKMRETLALRENYKELIPLTADINQYTHNYLRIQAGYRGDDIDVIEEIAQFAQEHQLNMFEWDTVHHFNADQPSCGVGCSGNPYDARWHFQPTGHGDLHEIGHTIERKELRFKGWETHTSTNHYAFYVKSRLPVEQGYERACKAIEQKGYFNKLQAAAVSDDPSATMASAKLNGWKDGASISIQTRMAAQKYGELENGWHLLPRQHIIHREFKQAIKNKNTWLAKRANLGFSQYSLQQAKKIKQNDWLLIATSHAAKLDFTDYYQMWGINFTDTAKAQVQSFKHEVVPNVFFNFSAKQYCETLDVKAIPIDGKQPWVS
ncbi:ImpA family metalloprotease [Thalassotalea fonticola]|uniref:ImpA family metalloprotease n=1 Tax=Thalassotalea fonticola TaxID=3065649 RepID=A0ABZ0GLE2_9GAMM|nr:ImpA family metalloprotease [Colwelliaceae bacterium S1-1]